MDRQLYDMIYPRAHEGDDDDMISRTDDRYMTENT
jgi:hypothetical protein